MQLPKWHEMKHNFFDFGTQRSAGSWRFLLEDLPRLTSVLGLIFCEGVALLALSRSSATSTNLDRTITIPAYTQSTRPFWHNRKNSTTSTAHASSCLYFFGWVALRQNFWRSLLCQMIWTVISLAYRQLRRDGMWVTNLGMKALKPLAHHGLSQS